MIVEIRTYPTHRWRDDADPSIIRFTLYTWLYLAGAYIWVPRTPGQGLYSWEMEVPRNGRWVT